MKIVIEANIPYIRGIFEPYATVEYLAAGDIDAQAVADADALHPCSMTAVAVLSALLQLEPTISTSITVAIEASQWPRHQVATLRQWRSMCLPR